MSSLSGAHIHIVCVDDGHIVPRMARWLVEAHGWSMHDRSNPSADLNYYMPYTAIVQGAAGTHTAAWFTHREHDNPGKDTLWRQAAMGIGLRLVTAPQYLDEFPVNSARITPGIDLSHFTVDGVGAGVTLSDIGVSGLGCPRKGEYLVYRMYADGYDIAAAGCGWGIPETMIPYEEMPQYYRTLGVFLCTSLIEGIPAPPLEALACGTKAVVPQGVGMLDELPEMPGIRHYEAGRYKDMVQAIKRARKDHVDPHTLRAAVKGYSKEAWCQSHVAAFEQVLEAQPA